MSLSNIVHVAVAVIENQQGLIFIAKRPEKSHQGGLWEFPGGKVEENETIQQALSRELDEEIGITVTDASPLIRVNHDYLDKSVLLDVWCVTDFCGEAHGKEGQDTCWIKKSELSKYDFPEANTPIIKALNLPDKYMITGDFDTEEKLLKNVQSAIDKGLKLIQFRAPGLSLNNYFSFAKKIYEVCKRNNVQLFLNTSFEMYQSLHAFEFSHGLHLNSNEIQEFPSAQRFNYQTSTSVHNTDELRIAEDKNIDLALLSPVKKTLSHPDSKPLGWKMFNDIVDKTNIPVYALGGMREKDIKKAKSLGAQGIAAIGEFWNFEE